MKHLFFFCRNLINKLAPVLVNAQKKNSTPKDSEKKAQEVFVYMNHLRQKLITKIALKNVCSNSIPYLVMDTGDEDNQSRKLFKPIVPNLIGNTVQMTSMMQMNENNKTAMTNRSNVIRAASTVELPTPESQMSYKPITPIAAPLPPNLKTLDRSKPISS
jgi:hypothetical protein